MLTAEREQALAVLRAYGMAMADLADAGVSRRRVELAAPLTLSQFPSERMLAPARPHHQNLHASSVSKGSLARIPLSWSNQALIATSGKRSGRRSSRWSSTPPERPCPRSID